jgi:hypothetical protein
MEIQTLTSNRPSQTVSSIPVQETPQPNQAINTALGCVAVALPIIFVLSVVGYRKYRANILKQQILKLEQIWNLNPQGKTH